MAKPKVSKAVKPYTKTVIEYLHQDSTTAQPQFDDHEGMNRNTELCVDLKTFLCHDRIAQPDKVYEGKLVRDEEMHFTFVEEARTGAKADNAKTNQEI